MQTKSIASILAALMCSAVVAAIAAAPDRKFDPIGLEKVVPKVFRGWSEVAGPVLAPQGPDIPSMYDEMLSRTYVNADGDRIMLSMAWGNDQRGERQAHRPELCYPAQGLKLETARDGTLPTSFGDISVRRLTTSAGSRHEPVTYWLIMAGEVVHDQMDKRRVQFRLLPHRMIPDGLLFRVSSIDRDPAHAFEVQQQFTADLLAALPADVRTRVSGL